MADQYALQEAVKPNSAATEHNQPVPDPIAHFRAIPWCARLMEDKANLDILVPDRRPLDSGESNFVRKTSMFVPTSPHAHLTPSSSSSSSPPLPSLPSFRLLCSHPPETNREHRESYMTVNTPTTIKASISFFRPVQAHRKLQTTSGRDVSQSAALLSGGGADHGENPKNPFLLFSALADLGVDCQSYAGTMHGGLYTVLMDEVMGTAANFQAANGAYTARFTTNYRRPVRTPQVVLVRGRVVKREGRKLHLRGSIEDKNGEVLAEAEGLWLCMAENVGRSQL